MVDVGDEPESPVLSASISRPSVGARDARLDAAILLLTVWLAAVTALGIANSFARTAAANSIPSAEWELQARAVGAAATPYYAVMALLSLVLVGRTAWIVVASLGRARIGRMLVGTWTRADGPDTVEFLKNGCVSFRGRVQWFRVVSHEEIWFSSDDDTLYHWSDHARWFLGLPLRDPKIDGRRAVVWQSPDLLELRGLWHESPSRDTALAQAMQRIQQKSALIGRFARM